MSDEREDQDVDGLLVIAGVALLAAFVLLAWLVASLTCLVGSAHLSGLSLIDAAASMVRVIAQGCWSDPRRAFPSEAEARMPAAELWWATTALVMGASAVVGVATYRRVEPQVARARLARRPGEWRGARPRSWARRRDFQSDLTGFKVGTLDGQLIRTHEEAHVALVAPTRAGKTTRYVVPWLLEHDGPAIVTSTKRDVLEATGDARREVGRVWVFDPFGDDSCSWDGLAGCDDWSGALRQAHWLAEATQQGDSELAGYWRGEASKLLAPLLHAAALEKLPIATVLEWVDEQDPKLAARVLAATGSIESRAAERQLQAVRNLDDRNRGTTFMSAGSILAAYRYPQVLAHSLSADLGGAALLNGPNTLYVVSSERHQRLLEPVLVALLSSLFHAAIEREVDTPRLRVLLDEAANIAPLRDLPRLMSQAAGHGVRIATVWQSLAQMQERYGTGMHTILANSAAKLVMGSTTDDVTRRYLRDLLDGDPLQLARELQHLESGRALFVGPHTPPAVVTVEAVMRAQQRRDVAPGRRQRAAGP